MKTLLLLLALLVGGAVVAQDREYQVKAVFLYNFGQFVEWPAGSIAPGAPFIIGIVGKDPFGPFLEETIRNEQLEGHPIQVQRYASVQDIKTCHVLFVGSNAREALAAVQGKPILTVSESPGFVQEGGMIQFFTEQKKMRFIIRPSAARSARLTISSKLLRLAKIED